MEFIKSTRGARLLVKDQYHFLKNKTGNGKTYWECAERRSGNGCRVKIILDDNDNLIQQTGEHEHIPNPEKIAVKKIRASMKRDAQVSNATTNNIIAANIAGAPGGVLAKVGKIQTVRGAFRRQRAAVMGYPEIPEGILFDIPEPFNRSSTGEPFIQFDNGREDRIVIFGTRESLSFLQNRNNWFMDGTFSHRPTSIPSAVHDPRASWWYSSLSNKRPSWNKRPPWNLLSKLISVHHRISVHPGNFAKC